MKEDLFNDHVRNLPAEQEKKGYKREQGNSKMFSGQNKQHFQARVANGRFYENDYCFIIELEDGRIQRLREYRDTQRAKNIIQYYFWLMLRSINQ